MNVRDHYTPGKAPDWSRVGNQFKPLTERDAEPVVIAWGESAERPSNNDRRSPVWE